MERFRVPDELADEVHDRIGVPAPTDVAGVGALYRAWCERIPFDSIGKALALQEGGTTSSGPGSTIRAGRSNRPGAAGRDQSVGVGATVSAT